MIHFTCCSQPVTLHLTWAGKRRFPKIRGVSWGNQHLTLGLRYWSYCYTDQYICLEPQLDNGCILSLVDGHIVQTKFDDAIEYVYSGCTNWHLGVKFGSHLWLDGRIVENVHNFLVVDRHVCVLFENGVVTYDDAKVMQIAGNVTDFSLNHIHDGHIYFSNQFEFYSLNVHTQQVTSIFQRCYCEKAWKEFALIWAHEGQGRYVLLNLSIGSTAMMLPLGFDTPFKKIGPGVAFDYRHGIRHSSDVAPQKMSALVGYDSKPVSKHGSFLLFSTEDDLCLVDWHHYVVIARFKKRGQHFVLFDDRIINNKKQTLLLVSSLRTQPEHWVSWAKPELTPNIQDPYKRYLDPLPSDVTRKIWSFVSGESRYNHLS